MPKFREIPLEEADLDQLRAFADQESLPFPPTINGAHLRALIEKAGYTKGHITLVEQAAPTIDISFGAPIVEGVDFTDPSQVDPRLKPYLVVDIMLNPGEGGSMVDADVDVDGRMMRIPRGKFNPIPYKYFEAIFHGKRIEYAESDRGLGVGQPVFSYPFQIRRIYEEQDPVERARIAQVVARMAEVDKRNMQQLEKRRRALEAAAAAA